MTEPIRKTLTVPLPPVDAFDLFTAGIDRWWPKESHSLSAGAGSAAAAVTMEPWDGGALYETAPDGRILPWGRVTRWDPGREVAFTWHVGRSPDEATHVTVRFSRTEGGTRVDLTHDGWQAVGGAQDGLRGSYDSGWDVVFAGRYAGAAAGPGLS